MMGLTLLAVAPRAYPQTPVVLGIKLYAGYAGLSITGAVGDLCSIECVTDLPPTNNWLSLTNFVLPSSPYLWMDTTVPATGRRFYRAVTVAVTPVTPVTNMLWIPPVTFTMGSPTNELERDSDEIQHDVTLTKGFYMGKFDVIQGEYQAVMGSNPSWFNGDRTAQGGQDFGVDLNRPVEQVSWFDATNYCDQLTQQEQAAGRIPTNWVYRLPTESEWEYACRAGTDTPFYYGQDLLSGMANFDGTLEYLGGIDGYTNNPSGTSLDQTTTVGNYQPNAFGLYDMCGNIWEWCQDWYGDYPTGSVTDPQGPPLSSVAPPSRVVRGGAYNIEADHCRSARRTPIHDVALRTNVGFRVVLAQSQ